MTAVIIEDEPLAARDLQQTLQRIDPQMVIAAVLPGIRAAREWFAAHPEPDLLFMDIQLSDGVSFDLFTHVPLKCPVIFTTAYNEYAIRAFKVNSVDYLLKPIDAAELTRAIEKYKRLHVSGDSFDLPPQIRQLMHDLRGSATVPVYKERFVAHYKNTLVPVTADQMAFICKDELIYIATFDHQKLISDFVSLEEVEQLLNPDVFFRANRQYILHIRAVDNIKPGFNGKLTVRLKSRLQPVIDVSREKAAAFKQWIG